MYPPSVSAYVLLFRFKPYFTVIRRDWQGVVGKAIVTDFFLFSFDANEHRPVKCGLGRRSDARRSPLHLQRGSWYSYFKTAWKYQWDRSENRWNLLEVTHHPTSKSMRYWSTCLYFLSVSCHEIFGEKAVERSIFQRMPVNAALQTWKHCDLISTSATEQLFGWSFVTFTYTLSLCLVRCMCIQQLWLSERSSRVQNFPWNSMVKLCVTVVATEAEGNKRCLCEEQTIISALVIAELQLPTSLYT